MEAVRNVIMSTILKFATFVLAFATVCSAQSGLSVRNKKNQKWPAAEAQRIYLSACSVVQGEFGGKIPLAPQVTLVLGADKDEVWFAGREIRLTKWDDRVFAQGVVWLAFEDLMPLQRRQAIAARALNWADATVEAEQAERQSDIQISDLANSIRELGTLAEIADLKQQIASEQLQTVLTQLELGNGAGSSPGGPPQLTPRAEQLARIEEIQKLDDAMDAGLDLSKARLGLLRALGHMQDWLLLVHSK